MNKSHNAKYGGGIKGLYSLYLLNELEKKYCKENETLSDYFDMICGTSTGGIIALGIASQIPIDEIIKLYEKNADTIFPSNNYNRFTQPIVSMWYNLWQLGGYKYSDIPLSKYLFEMFQDKKMIEAKNLLCIPSYNLFFC